MTKKVKKAVAAVMSALMCAAIFGGCKKDGGEAPGETPSQEFHSPLSRPDIGEHYSSSPELAGWTYGQVAIGGGGFVTGVFATPEKDVYYARTDVGGAYYRTADTGKWTSVSYWVSEEDRGLLGIDGLAFDPNSPNRVFMLAGTEYFSSGKTAVIISDDYGKNVTVVDITDKIKVHGNGMGRGNGERIAVDPNNGNIIFAGGRTGGMIKSTDGGYTWESVESFPVTSTQNANGINGILFDPSSEKGGAAQKIYASVSQKGDSNIFISEDGGATWSAMTNAITEYMPQRMKLDSQGNLYVTYGEAEGPWNSYSGCLYKYGTDGSAENISPDGAKAGSFGDIVIAPDDDNKLVLNIQSWEPQPNGSNGDAFFTSTDGGKSWHNVLDSMTMSTNGMDWVEGSAIHWGSSISIDPFNTGKIMVTSGNGIFTCDNIWADTPEFYFDCFGIEEVVPEDIVSLKDYPLISSIGDYDGFVHDDIYVSGSRHQDKIGSTTSITIAAQNKDVWAKVGGDESAMALTYTTDAGKTWKKITKSPESGKTFYKGKLALNADGSVLVWSPSNGMKAYWTDNWGESWNEASGIVASNVYLIGDPSNPDYVYGCGNSAFYVSSDGGRTFTRNTAVTPSFKRICADPLNEGTVYIPNGAGLLVTKDHGQTTEMVPNIKQCQAVGLGKAKNDGDPLVIYIWGMPIEASKPGLYMSEDQGESWVQVNNEMLQFGGTGNGEFVSGDMNVYGRCYMSTVGLGIIYFDKNDK